MSDNTDIDELPLDEDIEAVDELAEREEKLAGAETKPRKRFGAPALIASAFLSSAIGGGVVWLASQYYAPKAPDMTPLQTRLEALNSDVAALNAENEDLKASISSLENAPKEIDAFEPVDLTPIETRLRALEDAKSTEIDPELVTRLEALQSNGSEALDLSDILSRLDNVEKTASENPGLTDLSDDTEAKLADLTARLDAFENRPVTLPPVATLTAVSVPVNKKSAPVTFPVESVLASLPKEGGWLERSLKKHISVQSEENPGYLVELIQKSIDAGDLEAARAAFDKLPPEAKAAARVWRDSLND